MATSYMSTCFFFRNRPPEELLHRTWFIQLQLSLMEALMRYLSDSLRATMLVTINDKDDNDDNDDNNGDYDGMVDDESQRPLPACSSRK